jgi:membrane associated rhomboid family serine protease
VDTRTPGSSDLPLCQVAPGQWTKTPYGNGPFFLALAIAFGSTMVALHRSSFLKVAISSPARTVTLFLLIFGIPMLLLGLHLNFVEGTLTLDWAFHVAVYTLLIGAATGLLMWYFLVRPLRARATSNNRWRGP